jgi:RNA 3'-terminal phosphate cyclase (ATP)
VSGVQVCDRRWRRKPGQCQAISMLIIDGSHGEGGGAVLRNSLALSAVLGIPIRIESIRSKRSNPGLQAQHLTAVRALARICGATVEGAELGSLALTFKPGSSPRSGEYSWDVSKARKGGSAGATTLVFQALLIPLLVADAESRLFLRGGTHVAWSPPFHYLDLVYLPILRRMGIGTTIDIERWGWYPIGGGILTAQISGSGTALSTLRQLQLEQRGPLRRVFGFSAISNLPAHIAERQKRQAEEQLRARGFDPEIEIVDAPAKGQGTMVFLVAEFEQVRAGFTSLGRKGKPAETVAEEAVEEFLRYYESGAALDQHLADQLILPLALAKGTSSFTTCRITQHLLTNAWIVEQLLGRKVVIDGEQGKAGKVTVLGLEDV